MPKNGVFVPANQMKFAALARIAGKWKIKNGEFGML
ncbi:MAG: hypothetical protein K0R65_1979 [Crocinitomicaceae bacterium]|jgi:hypothetical protein|nr:hypothetical protein [Crocinitomicaceae bacterium]